MNTNNINPMDWHNTKMLDFIPEHFVRVKFRHNDKRMEVLNWLDLNTAGRCAIEVVIDRDNTRMGYLTFSAEEYQIGFENPADATMYTMFYR